VRWHRCAGNRGNCIFRTLTIPTPGALTGVRVLDLATLFPAPMVAAMLGDLGADVVKVEGSAGDPLRITGAMHGDLSYVWALVNRNKRAVQVDHGTPEGLDTLHALTAAADVIVLNQPTNVLERWGCTYDQLAARNPRAIVVTAAASPTPSPIAMVTPQA